MLYFYRMKSLQLLGLVFFAAATADAYNWNRPKPVAGEFDSYVLALEWLPQFCQTTPAVECGNIRPDSREANHLSLHGLWPDKNGDTHHTYGYCDVDPAIKALDNKKTWCKMPPPAMSPSTTETLAGYMPGVAACLENHEWYKHGTCSGLTADSYFFQMSALAAKFSTTAPGKFITANVGQTVAAEAMLTAFDKEFGAGGRRFAGLVCKQVRGKNMLAEVRLSLTTRLLPADQLSRMLLPAPSSNCPDSFLIVAPGAN